VHQHLNLHAVDAILFSFIVRGNGVHHLQDSTFEVHCGSVGITHFDEVHDILTDENGMEIFNIFINPEHFHIPHLPSPLSETLHVILPQERLFRNILNRSIHLEIPQAPQLSGVVKMWMDELSSRSPESHVVEACAQLFLTECCRAAIKNGIQAGVSNSNSPPPWVEKIRQFIDRHYQKPLGLDDFARLTGMSRSYICRAFKKYCGKGLIDVLLERRIQAAMLELRTNQKSILDISLICGFNDLSHFNRSFKKLSQTSPSLYRKKYQGKV
jgi:AraC-like DNA-binding protein